MRSLRLLITRRLSLRLIASWIPSSSWRTPMVISCAGGQAGPPLQRAFVDLLHIGFEAVLFLDVVVACELDAAFEAGLDLANVFLHAAQGFDGEILGDD